MKKSLLHKITPKFIRRIISEREIKKTIFEYYDNLPQTSLNEEEKKALAYLRNHKLSVFPYPFQHKYNKQDIEVHRDKDLNLKYVILDGKRLYFKRNSSARGIKRNYNFLQIEQDKESPHRYLTSTFKVEENDILVDVGAAEGILPLSVIEKVKKAYLFETDERWIEALNATFAPWKDKVEIINKFVSDKDDEKNVSLDNFFKDKEPFDFLKVDAEGAEGIILKGADKTISNNGNLKLVLCTYHKPHDAVQFEAHLKNKDFKVSFSDGYMIFTEPKTWNPPYLRKGVIRAKK